MSYTFYNSIDDSSVIHKGNEWRWSVRYIARHHDMQFPALGAGTMLSFPEMIRHK